MKRIILITLSILLSSTVAMAAPFIVCDPQTGVQYYKVTGPAWTTSPVTAQADGSIKVDVATSTVGVNSLTFAACRGDAIWGEACSTFVPFVFTRPVAPVAPTLPANIRLTP